MCTVLFVCKCVLYCLCVNVYCTAATGCQRNAVNKIYQYLSNYNGKLSVCLTRQEDTKICRNRWIFLRISKIHGTYTWKCHLDTHENPKDFSPELLTQSLAQPSILRLSVGPHNIVRSSGKLKASNLKQEDSLPLHISVYQASRQTWDKVLMCST